MASLEKIIDNSAAMQPFQLVKSKQKEQSFLFIGAHCDDIEIGCGGSVIQLAAQNPTAQFHWVVLSSTPDREQEAIKSAEKLLADVKNKTIEIKQFEGSVFPYIGREIKTYFEELKSKVNPDLIFTHYRHDLHQDHRITAEITWNTFRNHTILEYEIPKYDGDLASPNVFIPLSEEQYKSKIDHLMSHFDSQKNRQWYTRETFLATMRIRGIESNADSGYAEGFYGKKLLISFL